ncbi:hypothetical protein EDB85DRAFT_1403117 [Lactarius pseudohatsudake]|nr:hypothetical protein EDB85DRAFT_1403117 [Lactarius pseudohatsudake]
MSSLDPILCQVMTLGPYQMRQQHTESGRKPATGSARFIRRYTASGLPATILSPRGNKQSAHDVMHTAYSSILFGDTAKNPVVNDFTSTPDQLLDSVLNERAEGGTNFTAAIQASQAITIDNWNTERRAILSTGQGCHRSVSLRNSVFF